MNIKDFNMGNLGYDVVNKISPKPPIEQIKLLPTKNMAYSCGDRFVRKFNSYAEKEIWVIRECYYNLDFNITSKKWTLVPCYNFCIEYPKGFPEEYKTCTFPNYRESVVKEELEKVNKRIRIISKF